MAASPSSVLTRGMGSWGSVNLHITRGYGQASGGGGGAAHSPFRRKMGQPGQVAMGQAGYGGPVDAKGTT